MKNITRIFLFMSLLIGIPQSVAANNPNNEKSHLCIVNLSDKDVTHTKASNADKKDWKGKKFRPSYNFKDARINANSSRCEREIMNKQRNTAVYEMEFTFSNGEKLRFSNDQKQSAAEYNRIYDHDVTGSATQHMELYQASGYGTNAMYIRSKVKPDNSKWMGRLLEAKPDVKLNDLTMLGSHDAGMYIAEGCSISKADRILRPTIQLLKQATKTQTLSMLQQLQAGARYFDLRVYYDGSDYRMGHFSSIAGCYGAKLDDILSTVNNFIADKQETVILKFSHTMSDSPQVSKTKHEVINGTVAKVKGKLKGNLYTHEKSIDFPQTKLKQVSGKVIVVLDQEFWEYIKPEDGLFKYSDLNVYDKYPNTDSLLTMKRDQLLKLIGHGGWGNDDLFLLSWTLTPQFRWELEMPKLNVQALSNTANPWLPNTLAGIKAGTLDINGTKVKQKPNIVYIDFLDPYMGKAVIDFNF